MAKDKKKNSDAKKAKKVSNNLEFPSQVTPPIRTKQAKS